MKVIGPVNCLNFRFLDRLVSTLEEKKHHEVKLKEGLKDLYTKRVELQNSLSSSWPKQVSLSYKNFLKCKCFHAIQFIMVWGGGGIVYSVMLSYDVDTCQNTSLFGCFLAKRPLISALNDK